MARILIAEDSKTQAVHIRLTLEDAGYETDVAVDGAKAVAAIEAHPPDIVLTDLHMPEMNGLELVEKVRAGFPAIPVILMTADGAGDIAAKALRAGASSYIPKVALQTELLPTIASIVDMLKRRRGTEQVFSAVVESETTFQFGNDHQFVSALVSHLEAELQKMVYDDQTGLFRIVMALKEALINAIDHGNLELDSKLRDNPDGSYASLGKQRSEQEPYSNRHVRLTSRISPKQLTFVIRDEGPGFDPTLIPDPTDLANLVRAHGRGLMLIQSFMDEVHHNETGNEITMIKYRETPASVEASA